MAILLVTYVGDGTERFDRDIYDNHHIPLVTEVWRPFGLQRTEVYYAAETFHAPGVVAMCLCHFADRAGLDRALTAAESAAVSADIPTFTDIEPSRTIMTAAPDKR